MVFARMPCLVGDNIPGWNIADYSSILPGIRVARPGNR